MILQSIKMAFSAINANKMRSFLTMLGIIIGVVALVVLVSLVNGATSSITDQINDLGNDMLIVSVLDDKENPLKFHEVTALQESGELGLVAPYTQLNANAKHGHSDTDVTVYGTTATYYPVQGLELATGRFLKTSDVENSSYVTVLSYDAADELFGTANVVGESIAVNGRQFLVVGVLAEDNSMLASMMSDTPLYVPYSVATRMSDSGLAVTSFYASAASADRIQQAENSLNSLLYARFKQDTDAYSIVNMSTIADTMSSVTDILTLLLGGIAAISLLVGGIGIMNIMLVSVTERTREIGIRKAIGAGRGVILAQFLIEALALSLIGCLIGILLSWLIIIFISSIAGSSLSFGMSADVVATATAFSLGIGVLFGMYPANKASRKSPIEALRYDG